MTPSVSQEETLLPFVNLIGKPFWLILGLISNKAAMYKEYACDCLLVYFAVVIFLSINIVYSCIFFIE